MCVFRHGEQRGLTDRLAKLLGSARVEGDTLLCYQMGIWQRLVRGYVHWGGAHRNLICHDKWESFSRRLLWGWCSHIGKGGVDEAERKTCVGCCIIKARVGIKTPGWKIQVCQGYQHVFRMEEHVALMGKKVGVDTEGPLDTLQCWAYWPPICMFTLAHAGWILTDSCGL